MAWVWGMAAFQQPPSGLPKSREDAPLRSCASLSIAPTRPRAQVAFGRVRAAVPMSVRDTLLDRLGDPYEVAAAVQAAVQDISAAAPRLLAEHPHLAARRLWCAERQQRLREALEALHSPAAGVPLHP
eukprot:XP_001697795.1 predicted protein [Chlamydomonas reinhardtii]